MSRLKDRYLTDVVPALKKEFGYKTSWPSEDQEVVVNRGLGEATQNVKIVDTGSDELARITGQRPVTRRAKKSIAAFKLRKGMPVGTMVTLRGERMYEFLDRLMNVALPRVRDFRGVSPKGFDGRGNFTLGLRTNDLSGNRLHEGGQGSRYECLRGNERSHRSRGTQVVAVIGMPFKAQ